MSEQKTIKMSFKSVIYDVLHPKKFPLWIVILNYGSLSSILFYPFVALATYARLDDYQSFYQPTSVEYVFIYTYPLFLVLISHVSYRTFKASKIVSVLLPVATMVFYIYLWKSGVMFEINHDK